jgi:catechol 2,3-dioxygenase-like lactoylglutathione lyase family enzyme
MSISNALAGVAVSDLDAAVAFYQRILGLEANRPMPEVAEWKLPRGGCLQVFADGARAGKSSVTLVVTSLKEQLADLKAQGVDVRAATDTTEVKTAIVSDPDGNQVVFAEPLGDRVVS